MTSQLTLKVGNATSTINFNGTDQQVASVLTRFANSLGIPVGGTPTENLTAILEHIRDDVKRRSREVQARELRAANEAAITGVLDADNGI